MANERAIDTLPPIFDLSTDLSTGISERQDWCDNNTNDIDIVLEYNPVTSVLSNQLIEIRSSDDPYLYYNPYLYLNYDKEKEFEKRVNPESVIFSCKIVKAKTEIYMGGKKILKILK